MPDSDDGDDVRYVRALFNNRESLNQAAPEPIFLGPDAGTGNAYADDITISALNPGDPANTVAPVGRLKLVKAEGKEVQRGDDGMFRLTQAAQATRGATLQADPSIRVMSGVLEGSNVKPVAAMSDMIASARRFEMQMKIISSVDENAGKANQLLAMS